MRTVRRLVVIVAIAVGIGLASAAPAAAHNALVGSDPEEGAVTAEGPDRVTLRFLSTIDSETTELSVVGPDGQSVLHEEPDFDGSTVTIPVRTVHAGGYLVEYEVLSNDGHVVTGTVEFTVTGGEEPSPSPSPAALPEPTTAAPAVPPAPAAPAAGSGEAMADAEAGSWPWWAWLVAGAVVVLGAVSCYDVIRRWRAD